MKQLFLERMQSMLKEEYEEYVETLSMPAYRGLRINRLKDGEKRICHTFSLEPSLFCRDGYYIKEEVSGNHPYHLQGLFYMQEPSASSAVSVLDVQKGDWVLDLCAAPGGKSSQIASCLGNTGFLLSNEVNPSRASILMSNMERMGVSENMITSAPVEVLCEEMQGLFDKVLVDAPCSGEGMFKKHEKAMEDWSEEHVQACAARQKQILESAYHALKQDGILVYSTCTYAIEENEQVVHAFLKAHEDLELLDCAVTFGRSGIPYKDLEVHKLRRIFPMDGGEGHFIAKIRKHKAEVASPLIYAKEEKWDACVQQIMQTQLDVPFPYIYTNKERVYIKQTPFIKLKKTRILRQGVLCGEMVKKRFEPHHHLYMCAAWQGHFLNSVSLNEEECHAYLQGHVLTKPCKKGYVAVLYEGFALGFGKSDGKVIKNKYPKGLRIR